MERVIKHDKEAFKTAWDFLAESSDDEEDDKGFVLYLSVFRCVYPPVRGLNLAVLGATVFLPTVGHAE